MVIGIFASCVLGGIHPTFGLFMSKMLFALMIPVKSVLRSESNKWCLAIFLISIGSFVSGWTQKFLFGIVGENITFFIRQRLYGSFLRKSIDWFDRRENAPGVLASVLATDVQTLNGASTEGAAVILESFFALGVGVALGFAYSWKVSLVALGCIPFLILGGSMNAKM